jgi:hypothetical protein
MRQALITASCFVGPLGLSGCQAVVGPLYERQPASDAGGLETPSGQRDAGLGDAPAVAELREGGLPLGIARLGYYYAALESSASGPTQSIPATSCAGLLTVAREFADAVCVQGVGKLRDGGVLAYAGSCSCGFECSTGGRACYERIDAPSAPWGRGSSGRPLVALRSIAVGRDGTLAGRALYAPALDGLSIAASESTGAFVHDGCLTPDDTGVFDQTLALRLFTGDATQYDAVRAELGNLLELSAGHPRCDLP